MCAAKAVSGLACDPGVLPFGVDHQNRPIGGQHFVLFPKTKENPYSISVDLHHVSQGTPRA
jgi:hypothetical protein